MSLSTIYEYFRFAVFASLCAGLVCPLVGAFLLVRRSAFQGIVLPQFATAGVAAGYALLPYWVGHLGLRDVGLESAFDDPHAILNFLLFWAGAITALGLLSLAFLGQKRETEAARLAAAFALASAATLFLSGLSPVGGEFVETLLRGEVLAIDSHDFETLAVGFGALAVALLYWRKPLLLWSYDRDTAQVCLRGARRYEYLFAALVGLCVSIGTLVAGPLVLFGLLVLPPLAAQPLARSFDSFLALSSGLGLLSALVGLLLSFGLDLPLGPSLIAGGGLLLALCSGWGRLRQRFG